MAANKIKLEIDGRSINESFARTAVSSFTAQLDPTIEELTEIKTAVSEAVSNSIIHGYKNILGTVVIECEYNSKREVTIRVSDSGMGIDDISLAMQPLYTTCKDKDRSGMGFTIMESFMNSLEVKSSPGHGTSVVMTKQLSDGYEE